MPLGYIERVEFWIHKEGDQNGNDEHCFDAKVGGTPQGTWSFSTFKPYPEPRGGGCPWGFVRWEGLTAAGKRPPGMTETGDGVVGAVFKNWSDRKVTAQMRIWHYSPAEVNRREAKKSR